MAKPRISKVFGAVNVGSFRISAMIMGLTEQGETIILGSGHRASQGIKRGYVTDMSGATYAIRDAVKRAEESAEIRLPKVWINCAGAGLANQIAKVEINIDGRRIEEDDIEKLLATARDSIQPDGRMVLHAQPTDYTLDGGDGAPNPEGLYAERLGVDIHVILAEGAPVRNLIEAVQNAHLEVAGVVAAPIAASYACLSLEERSLGTALIEIGGDVTNVSVHSKGMVSGLKSIPMGAEDITDAIASAFGIRRFEAGRLKCVSGSAIASPSDHQEMIPVLGSGDPGTGSNPRGADDHNQISRADLVAVVTEQLSCLTDAINKALKELGFAGARGNQVVLTGGGAELAGIAEFAQSALGRSVRIGRVVPLRGLPEAHSAPGFASLSGLCLYAVDDPVDIRSIQSTHQNTVKLTGAAMFLEVLRAFKKYF